MYEQNPTQANDLITKTIDYPSGDTPVVVQASSDVELIRLWLHGRPVTTRRAYEADVAAFFLVLDKPLRTVTLGDVQRYDDSLLAQAPASRVRRLAVAKSLLSFGHRIGYLQVNVGAVVKAPKLPNKLAERIVEKAEIERMLTLEPNVRNHLIVQMLYVCGLRLSELCGLSWKDVVARKSGGQITVVGKGAKTRAVLVPNKVWRGLMAFREKVAADDPVFVSGKKRRIHPSQGHRIVKAAAKRAGLPSNFSPHWLRHAHISHALDAGAAAHLVRDTVGHASLTTTDNYAHARPGESSSTYLSD
ncbi:MAG: tyrosine-type recombinase/integrase [Janthinobacterium lividum]